VFSSLFNRFLTSNLGNSNVQFEYGGNHTTIPRTFPQQPSQSQRSNPSSQPRPDEEDPISEEMDDQGQESKDEIRYGNERGTLPTNNERGTLPTNNERSTLPTNVGGLNNEYTRYLINKSDEN
jgi:hypothetical protein